MGTLLFSSIFSSKFVLLFSESSCGVKKWPNLLSKSSSSSQLSLSTKGGPGALGGKGSLCILFVGAWSPSSRERLEEAACSVCSVSSPGPAIFFIKFVNHDGGSSLAMVEDCGK